jgi:hypothetical protein
VRPIARHLERRGFDIEFHDSGRPVLRHVKSQGPLDLLIVDLQMTGERYVTRQPQDGLSVAKSASEARPWLPVVAITQHLPLFAIPIAERLSDPKQRFPFDSIWQKNQLTSNDDKDRLAQELEILCDTEHHTAEVVEMENDFSLLRVKTESGEEYERSFETELLRASGILMAGDKVGISFTRRATGSYGCVSMRVWLISPATANLANEAKKILASANMERIREKFPAVHEGRRVGQRKTAEK